ncbi:DUF2607 family protein [Vibrio methylphosphonaticus]|uniref:DUF2607 family protein n=1 Tax=Vibrio methylphosphonaticus TaxID=2946866 RepID=UPI00202A72BB|nr:DUF2607 family protein [Vibrio methylphosphonaticus]MCL9777086.1 DUF2607 family protein [Vibrio methylphosphonaticus]
MPVVLRTHAATPGTTLYHALALAFLLLAINFISIEHHYDTHSDHQHHHCALYGKGSHSILTSSLTIPTPTFAPDTTTSSFNEVANQPPLSVTARSPPMIG